MQMIKNGTGVYYKSGIPRNKYSQFICDTGLIFKANRQSRSFSKIKQGAPPTFLDLSLGYRREWFNEMLVGVFRPVTIIQGGGVADIKSISWKNGFGEWLLSYAAGIGLQFYNVKLLNEIMLKSNLNTKTSGNLIFQISMYWK